MDAATIEDVTRIGGLWGREVMAPRAVASDLSEEVAPDLEFLRRGHWFGGLPAGLQSSILARSIVRSYKKGAHIVREGAACRGVYAVLAGRVHVRRGVGASAGSLFHVGEAGFWFGEYGTLSGAPAIASIVAATSARVLLLPAAEFELIVAAEPRYFRLFATLLIDRYAIVFRYASEAKGLAAEEWLCTRLQDLARMHRLDAPGDGPVDIHASQAELATMVGVSRQTLCMLLGRLQERGLIEVNYKKIRVLAPTGLHAWNGNAGSGAAMRSPAGHAR